MYQASLYLKTNLRVCLFTTSKGIKIGPPCQELRGVSKLSRTLKHPVEKPFCQALYIDFINVNINFYDFNVNINEMV